MDSAQIQKLHHILPHFLGCECSFEDDEGKSSTGVITIALLLDFKIPALRPKGKKSIVRITPYVRSFFNLTNEHIIDLIALSTNFEEFPNKWIIEREINSANIVQSQTATHKTDLQKTIFKIDKNFNIVIEILEKGLAQKQFIQNQAEITLYLITNYFDIFRLKEAGLAREILDKTNQINNIKQGI